MERSVYKHMTQIEDHHWWFKGRQYILTGLLESLALPRNAALLEVGSGTGANITFLREFGELFTLEPDETARELCMASHGVEPDSGALPGLTPYPEESFDLVAAFDVLEHIDEDLAALEAIYTLLKPGGRLVMTVPAFPFLWSDHDASHHHYRRYRRRPLQSLLSDAGYEVSFVSYYNCWLFPLIALARGLKSALPGSRAPDEGLPPLFINRILYRLFSMERGRISRHQHLPFGVSLVAVATKQRG